VRVVVFVADKNSFAGSSHAMLNIVLFKAPKACEDRGVFFRLGFFGAESVVGEGIEAYCFGLIGVEGLGKDWGV